MGGWGSGRQCRSDSKRLAEEAMPLDIRLIKRKNLLIPGARLNIEWSKGGIVQSSIKALIYEDYLTLQYTYNKTENVSQKIYFTYTPCNYGEKRVWFSCPFCGKRCAVIYSGGKHFACRACCDLTYAICNKHPRDRPLIKANKLRKIIGASPGMVNPLPEKPKGMHQKTWTRIKYEIQYLEGRYITERALIMGVPG